MNRAICCLIQDEPIPGVEGWWSIKIIDITRTQIDEWTCWIQLIELRHVKPTKSINLFMGGFLSMPWLLISSTIIALSLVILSDLEGRIISASRILILNKWVGFFSRSIVYLDQEPKCSFIEHGILELKFNFGLDMDSINVLLGSLKWLVSN